MTAGIALIFLAAACVAAFVLAPLFRTQRASGEAASSALSEEQELTSQREMALSALRDVEDDRATGKIDERDYEEIKARLTTRAVAILKRLDEISAPRSRPR